MADLLECFDRNLVVLRELEEDFKIFLKAVAGFFGGDFDGFPVGENFFDELIIFHIRCFPEGGFRFKGGLISSFFGEKLLKTAYNLDESFGERL